MKNHQMGIDNEDEEPSDGEILTEDEPSCKGQNWISPIVMEVNQLILTLLLVRVLATLLLVRENLENQKPSNSLDFLSKCIQ